MPTGTLTISTYTTTPPQQVDSSSVLEVRGWYSRDFVSTDLVTPIFGNSTNGEQGPYYSTTPSLNSGGEIVVPAHDVQITVGANPTANYFEGLWIDGAFVMYLMPNTQGATGWQIPSVYGDPIAYDEIATYNRARRLVYAPDSYFTADQTIQEIERIAGDFAYAAVNVNGITSMDFAPADASLPISVGSNSPRVEWAIYAGNYVTSGSGTVASPAVLNKSAIYAAAEGIAATGLQGATLVLGRAVYDVGSGLSISDLQLHLIGSGGIGETGSTPAASCVLVSSQNAPIIKYPFTAGRHSYRARLENVAIWGNNAGTSQHGVWVDNGGILMNNVSINGVGGNGLYLTHSNVGGYTNFEVSNAKVDAVRLQTAGSASAGAGINNNHFSRLSLTNINTGKVGIHFLCGSGNNFYGVDIENENGASKGIHFDHECAQEVQFNKVYGYWPENLTTDLEFAGQSQNNHVQFVRKEHVPIVVANSIGLGNTFSGGGLYGTAEIERRARLIVGPDAAQYATVPEGVYISDGNLNFPSSAPRIRWGVQSDGTVTLAQIGISSSTNMQILDSAGTSAGSLTFGLATSLFPQLMRNGSGLDLKNGDNSAYGLFAAKSVRGVAVTFANLPGTAVEGMLVGVTDSTTATWGANIAGGGTNHVLAYYNGTSWTVAGK